MFVLVEHVLFSSDYRSLGMTGEKNFTKLVDHRKNLRKMLRKQFEKAQVLMDRHVGKKK